MTELLRAWKTRFRKGLMIIMLGAAFIGGVAAPIGYAYADDKGQIMEGFIAHQSQEHGVKAISDHRRHQILFIMGAFLIFGVLATAGFGIAMALFNKEVFLAHMVTAGFTVFLALAHAVASMIWFFPF